MSTVYMHVCMWSRWFNTDSCHTYHKVHDDVQRWFVSFKRWEEPHWLIRGRLYRHHYGNTATPSETVQIHVLICVCVCVCVCVRVRVCIQNAVIITISNINGRMKCGSCQLPTLPPPTYSAHHDVWYISVCASKRGKQENHISRPVYIVMG